MAKGLGIAALIIALLAFFIPIYGWLVSVLALAIAAIGALAGERTFAIVVLIISALNIYVLSPSAWILFNSPDGPTYLTISIIGMIAPIAAIVLNSAGKLAIGGGNAA